jgi:hypothetical protein
MTLEFTEAESEETLRRYYQTSTDRWFASRDHLYEGLDWIEWVEQYKRDVDEWHADVLGELRTLTLPGLDVAP